LKEFAEILVNQKIYTYSVPEELCADAGIGCAAEVTLRGRVCAGYILRFVARPEFQTIAVRKITSPPNFDENLLKLAEWVADYYKCFPETALKLIIPKR
jgi:primosomal protein N' (replication factor Y)